MIAAVTLAIMKLADIALDLYLSDTVVLFPPRSQAHYTTADFDIVATINEFGFRGPETSLEDGQIIVVGDSFTFGFGSPDDAAWPRLLERKLNAGGDERRVYNLGVPGTDTMFHLGVAKEYAAALNPSLVIVAVLAADDFQQVHERRTAQSSSQRVVESVKEVVKTSFAGVYQLYLWQRYARAAYSGAGDSERGRAVTETWVADASQVIRNGTPLPDQVAKQALTGGINPGLFSMAAAHPERSWKFWRDYEERNEDVVETIGQVQASFEELRARLAAAKGQLLIFSMPSGEYVRSAFTDSYRSYGASIPESNLLTEASELALRSLANRVGADFVPALRAFRQHVEHDPFFPTDGHLSAEGNDLVAGILAEHLLAQRRMKSPRR